MLPAFQKWHLHSLVFLYLLSRICPSCAWTQQCFTPDSFFVFCCARKGVSRCKHCSKGSQVPDHLSENSAVNTGKVLSLGSGVHRGYRKHELRLFLGTPPPCLTWGMKCLLLCSLPKFRPSAGSQPCVRMVWGMKMEICGSEGIVWVRTLLHGPGALGDIPTGGGAPATPHDWGGGRKRSGTVKNYQH